MGWAGGGDVVEPVLVLMLGMVENDDIHPMDAESILHALIRSCQGRDWDTEEETLGEYQDVPWVVSAFWAAGVYLPCGAETDAEGLQGQTIYLTCDLPRGHTVDHRDSDYETEWPLATEGN